jgi:uncharacterized protein
MPTVVRDARAMIAGMTPLLRPQTYIFLSTTSRNLIDRLRPAAICIFREDEGTSMIVDIDAVTNDADIDSSHPMRRIVLQVYSSLEGFGLTAAVASALSEERIACNMVAAFYHDHVFVLAGDAERAMEILVALQREAWREGGTARRYPSEMVKAAGCVCGFRSLETIESRYPYGFTIFICILSKFRNAHLLARPVFIQPRFILPFSLSHFLVSLPTSPIQFSKPSNISRLPFEEPSHQCVLLHEPCQLQPSSPCALTLKSLSSKV